MNLLEDIVKGSEEFFITKYGDLPRGLFLVSSYSAFGKIPSRLVLMPNSGSLLSEDAQVCWSTIEKE